MKNQINFSNVNPISQKIEKLIKSKISKVIKNKNFILGNEVKIFEKNFSKKANTKYAIGCATGTDALILSLMSLNLKKRDEVIVPGMSYISTGLAVILNNIKLVFVDIDSETGLIDINQVKKKITKNTKVVIPVNLYGQRVNITKLRGAIGKKIRIIEDSAQSHFAYDGYKKKIIPNKTIFTSCYSFYPAKNLGAYGDGGIITTSNKSIYNKLIGLRNLGSIKKYQHLMIGLNSRLDTLQAAILNEKLKYINQFNDKRRNIAKIYDDKLKYINQIKLTKTEKGSSRHLYVIRTKRRDNLIKYLSKKGISAQIHYPYSLNKLEAFKNKVKKVTLKNSESWAKECLSLPIHPNLTKKEAEIIVKEIKNYFKYV